MELKPVEDTSWLQLFNKNTALCKHESDVYGVTPGAGRLIDGVSRKRMIEAPVNGGRNYNGPKVRKFLSGKFRMA